MMTASGAVTDFWQGLGLPGLIDIHTHFLPEKVMKKVWAYFDRAGPLVGRSWPIAYREDESSRIKRLRELGVRAFTSLIYPHKEDMATWLNEWAAEFAEKTPGCLHTATFYPEQDAESYVADVISSGARVFKAHIQVGGYHPNDPLLDRVWGTLEDSGIPTVIHCGSGPVPGRFTGPGPIREVLARHPKLKLIVAHMGMPEYAEFLDLVEKFPHVYLDTTMAFTDFAEEIAPFPVADRVRLRNSGERILFGSDFPNIPYEYETALTALERLELGDEWLRNVCYHNANRLFGIEQ